MLEKVIENWTSRLDYIRASPMPEIIFKIKELGLKVGSHLKWAGPLARMNEDRCCKKILLAKPMGNRPQGRPLLRWIDCVEKDLKILKVKNLKKVAKSRDAWKRLLEKARAVEPLEKNIQENIKFNLFKTVFMHESGIY
ncbi:hypothetical protein TNCV_1202711 [Trichonephila clavipes]|nr:hypothetical protein TNCV_1202711 [Trichonephila clavipes]